MSGSHKSTPSVPHRDTYLNGKVDNIDDERVEERIGRIRKDGQAVETTSTERDVLVGDELLEDDEEGGDEGGVVLKIVIFHHNFEQGTGGFEGHGADLVGLWVLETGAQEVADLLSAEHLVQVDVEGKDEELGNHTVVGIGTGGILCRRAR